jgi:hypothetical protein
VPNEPSVDEGFSGEPLFAKGGAACDTKAAPVKDYFTVKSEQQAVNGLVHDLGFLCATGPASAVMSKGFEILSWVEDVRERDLGSSGPPDPPSDWTTRARAGAMIVAVVVDIMYPSAVEVCSACDVLWIDYPDGPPVPAGVTTPYPFDGVWDAVEVGMVGVVGGDNANPVISLGGHPGSSPPDNCYDDTCWGIEPSWPEGGPVVYWSAVLPESQALVLGFPAGGDSPLDETDLGDVFAYDITVSPYTFTVGPLTVGVDVDAETLGFVEKVGHGELLLEQGFCSWCENSASGKARDFSVFNAYELFPEGRAEFITQPKNTVADAVIEGCGATGCGPIQVMLESWNRSRLSGNVVFVVISAEDNNGSWTLTCNGGEIPDVPNACEGEIVTDHPEGLVYQWTDLALDKPGAYKLHLYRTLFDGRVVDDDGNLLATGINTVGLNFPAISSQKFNVNPH